MSSQKLCVGATVRVSRAKAKAAERSREYRIEQLIEIEEGTTLYKIKCVSEPFYRMVSKADLATRC